MNENFARNLIYWRGEKNLTQQQLGDAAGVSPSQISRYEAGTAHPRKTVLRKIADTLEVSTSELVGEKDEDETVHVRLAFSDSPDESVTFAASTEAYQSLIDMAEKFGLTPGELLERYLEVVAEAARDPDNASEGALKLLDAIKFKYPEA